ncbi:Aste57867_8775 [Aphanomyces stellatus]|uniref:Aste57867_8775 protein n=1 Tax=Aphanomyces stellatus TaxID=120398 RepID=A0A485KLB9_9STRA|nr:hypothetical protein As57867_008741 [Aphanomyces stellatus]VFT85661.1 Aste57867_8775 [Aphanomyces stellatus]
MNGPMKRKLSETTPEGGKYDDLMAQGKLLRSTASRIPTQESLYSCRVYYLNQALDSFQQALNFSPTLTTQETQECLEQIRETQIDLMVLSKVSHKSQPQSSVALKPKKDPLRVTVRHRPLLPSDSALLLNPRGGNNASDELSMKVQLRQHASPMLPGGSPARGGPHQRHPPSHPHDHHYEQHAPPPPLLPKKESIRVVMGPQKTSIPPVWTTPTATTDAPSVPPPLLSFYLPQLPHHHRRGGALPPAVGAAPRRQTYEPMKKDPAEQTLLSIAQTLVSIGQTSPE